MKQIKNYFHDRIEEGIVSKFWGNSMKIDWKNKQTKITAAILAVVLIPIIY